jgi:poly-gamma-glutamate capsule biosynthesis protein CapA/YwtB (metallophosphatase superfamily)
MYNPLRYLVFVLTLLPLITGAQTDTLRLVFAGDVMGHLPQIKSAEVKVNEAYDYKPCFKYVKPILERADLAVGNLEVTLPGKPPYSGYPQFRSPDDLARDLAWAGFDILVTSNNHSNDAGKDGVIKTIETVKANGMFQTGTFKDMDERSALYPLMVYKKGFKIAFLNYTYGTNGIPTTAPVIVNLIDTVQMQKDLEEAKSMRPHAIIVVMHWGLEYQLAENAEQRQIAKFLLRHGADLIIGSHPHVVQPIKEETVTDIAGKVKKATVVYSLGNFISNQTKVHTDGGILFETSLIKNKTTGNIYFAEQRYIPVFRQLHTDASGKITYYALPAFQYEADAKRAPSVSPAQHLALKTFLTNTRNRLNPAGAVERKW